MPKEPPPLPPRRTSWAYALAAAAIWAMAAYDLLAPKPAPQIWTLAAAEWACAAR
ncbi:MAG: hypothetical protein ACXU82_17040 [Caulobacteraceae bacterium]